MNAKHTLLNSLLLVSLTAVGSSYADDVPVAPVLDRETIRAEHRAATANMTPAERDAYRAEQQAAMTPEQRAALRAKGSTAAGQGVKARDGSELGSQGAAANRNNAQQPRGGR
jgi:hypothetical protein